MLLCLNPSRLHTGDQPYPCTACGEGFRTKAELNQHNRATHGGLNPNSANTTIVVSGSQQQQMVCLNKFVGALNRYRLLIV